MNIHYQRIELKLLKTGLKVTNKVTKNDPKVAKKFFILNMILSNFNNFLTIYHFINKKLNT